VEVVILQEEETELMEVLEEEVVEQGLQVQVLEMYHLLVRLKVILVELVEIVQVLVEVEPL